MEWNIKEHYCIKIELFSNPFLKKCDIQCNLCKSLVEYREKKR